MQRTTDIPAWLLAIWAVVSALFQTDGQLVVLTMLIVAANSGVKIYETKGIRRAWDTFLDFGRNASAYLLLLAFAQAGANKFEVFGWLDITSYSGAYIIEFTRLGKGVAARNPAVSQFVSMVGTNLSQAFKHTKDANLEK